MALELKCKWCKQPFKPTSGSGQLYCSVLCKSWGRAGWLPVDDVRQMRAAGMSAHAIARKLNVPKGRVLAAFKRDDRAKQAAQQPTETGAPA